MSDRILATEKKVARHSLPVRLVHWTVALSTLALIFSGFGQMPMYYRYYVYKIPGLWWSADFSITLIVHYIAAAVLLLAVGFHAVYHLIRRDFGLLPRRGDVGESWRIIKAMLTGGEEPPSGKYLAEQRLAYAFIAFWLLVIIVSGVIKVLKNLPAVSLGGEVMVWVNALHNIGTFMLLIGIGAHLAAFLFWANRPLLPGMFSGKVDLDYARHRHSLWYETLAGKQDPEVDCGTEGEGCP